MKGLRNFAVAFAISLLIVGIVAAVVVNSVEGSITSVFNKKNDSLANILASGNDVGKNNNTSDKKEDDNKLENIEGNSFSVLIVCTDYRPDIYDNYYSGNGGSDENVGIFENGIRLTGVSNICLVKCSKEMGEFVFTPISPLTNVYTPTGYDTLYNIYGKYGFDFFLQKIESITGITVDYHAVVNCTDIKKIVDVIGAVNCTVPCEIFTDGKEYVGAAQVSSAATGDGKGEYESFLEACTDNIGPSSMGLLLYRDFTNGISDELSIVDSYTKGVFRNFAKLSDKSMGSVWSRIQQYMKYTNITSEFFTENAKLINAYTDELSTSLTYPGNFKPAGQIENSTFEPDITRAVLAFSKYR